MKLKIICTVLHCINLVIGAAIASGYKAQWLGFALLATAALDGYLTTQIPAGPAKREASDQRSEVRGQRSEVRGQR